MSAPLRHPVDDPATCIDPPFPEDTEDATLMASLRKSLPPLYAKMRHCGANLPADEEARFRFVLGFEPGKRQSNVFLEATTTTHCAVGTCLQKVLERHLLSKKASLHRWKMELQLELAPGMSPVELPRDNAGWYTDTWGELAASECTKGKTKYYGTLAPGSIQTNVRESYGTLRQCYESALARWRDASGKVQIRFIIDNDGNVPRARVSDNTLGDCEAVRCIRDAYLKLKFPRPESVGVITVVYPIQFQPG